MGDKVTIYISLCMCALCVCMSVCMYICACAWCCVCTVLGWVGVV